MSMFDLTGAGLHISPSGVPGCPGAHQVCHPWFYSEKLQFSEGGIGGFWKKIHVLSQFQVLLHVVGCRRECNSLRQKFYALRPVIG